MATFIIAQYCSNCNKYFKPINRDSTNCSICGKKTVFKSVDKYNTVFENDVKSEVVNIAYGENPRYSVSLGVSENQIEEARKLHPQVEWKKFGHSYRPLIKNRAEKHKIMKQANYEEYDPKDFKGRER